MKNILLTLALLLTVSFAFATNSNVEKDKIIYSSADGTVISVINNADPNNTGDALHCKTTCLDGTVYSCWLCKCSNLPSCSGGGNISPE